MSLVRCVVCDDQGKVVQTSHVPEADALLQTHPDGTWAWIIEADLFDKVDPVTKEVTPGFFLAPPLTLEQEKVVLLRQIDQAAGHARTRYITSTSGQEATYLAKAEQATAYKAAGYPDPCSTAIYPFIALESTALSMSPATLADSILTERDAWLQKGAQIEAVRRGAKVAISAATTYNDMEEIRDSAFSVFNSL